MPKISASSSIGTKLKFFSEYENISIHSSISIERDAPDNLSDDELVAEAGKVYEKCRKYVETRVNEDIASAKGNKAKLP